MDDVPDNDYHSLEQDRPGHHPSLGPPHYQEGYPLTQLYYPRQPASPQNTLSRHFQPQVHSPQSLLPHASNYMSSPFPGVPPMAYYYPYSPVPPAVPQFGYPNANISVSQPRDTLYDGSCRSSSMGLRPHPGVGSSSPLASTNMYSRMVYPLPGLYQYPSQPLPVLPQFPSTPHFPVTPRAESWRPGPLVGTDYEQHSAYALQRPFSAHTMGPHTSGYVSFPSQIPHVPPLSDTPHPSSSLLPSSPSHPSHGFPHTSETAQQSARLRQKPQGNRRPYQPNAPSNRSEWVMWVGNIPTDCSHDELLRFFQSVQYSSSPSTPVSAPSSELHSGAEDYKKGGILSIFLISHSNCAFVNYDSEAELHHAVATCNGRCLRPNNPRCLPLVCKVRNRDEDFRAGVGAQRGLGIHARWVQQYKAQAREPGADHGVQVGPPSGDIRNSEGGSPPERRTPSISSGQSPSSGERPTSHSPATVRLHDSNSGSVSFASTNSSLLANYFPQRYFILKSLTHHGLNLSVERKLWETQPHNEVILDRAYRTSKDVFLIFGANKSGEFFGYARMAGPIANAGSRQVNWSSRSDTSPVPSLGPKPHPTIQKTGPGSVHGENESDDGEEYDQSRLFLSPQHRPLRESRGQISPRNAKKQPEVASAPAVMDQRYRPLTVPSNRGEVGTDEDKSPFHGDRAAPLRAVRHTLHPPQADEVSSSKTRGEADVDSIYGPNSLSLQEDPPVQLMQGLDDHSLHSTGPEGSLFPPLDDRAQTSGGVTTWGTPFPVEWIRVQPLPFHRTRHLRNPWNTDREVKVSRDGTELEPEIGRRLLSEWDELPATPTGEPSRRPLGGRATSGRGPRG